MSTTNDSVQTLLKQRRELRQCLQELREEISDLNKRAQSMPPPTTNTGQKQVEKQVTPKLIASASPHQTETPEKTMEKGGANETSKPQEVTAEPSPTLETATENKEKEKEKEISSDGATPEKSEQQDEEDVALEDEVEGLDDTSLLYRAKLLADYLANHPTAIDPKNLEILDRDIQSVEAASNEQEEEKSTDTLRVSYRTVSSASYAENRISGETLADSMGNVTLLWGLPVLIAGLILVAFPFILLVQSVAGRMFVPSFSTDILLVLEGIIAFLWGGAGAVSALSWQVASDVRKRTYFNGMIRDLGLRFAFGGVLALACLLIVGSWLPFTGILEDMVVGVTAFFIGIPSALLFNWLFRFLVYR